ncbi:hypothetical protein PIB30_017885 [Stylosanthes scabra]|uniref:Uncharacterized protein n=1 Tax=Stylosanthes scabra TaxID=79078 RepID=A0ABU6Y9Q1_9FABA|nr:hypothetical protein [Stylosanthes scabra]
MAEVGGNGPGRVVQEVEGAQMPHELNPLNSWATRDVLGSPSTLTEDYLRELKEFGVICGGGEEERNYRVELPRRRERICELNLEHPRVPHWLWVNEVMFTEFGVRIPFSSFQQRIFGLYEESFHDFKGRYFKVFPVGDHPPFWLTLERDAGRFPSYWSKDAGLNYTPVTYRSLRRCWGIPNVLGRRFVGYAGESSGFDRPGTFEWPSIIVGSRRRGFFQRRGRNQCSVGGFFSDPGGRAGAASRNHPCSQRDLCPIDRSFDASGFIESNFLGPWAMEALRDYDLIESTRWVQWAMLRSATILKSVEPRLTLADQLECRCTQLTGEMRLLDQRRADEEKEKAAAEVAKSKAKKDLEVALEASKGKDVELQRLGDREAALLADIETLKKNLLEEKTRADKAESSLAESEKGR